MILFSQIIAQYKPALMNQFHDQLLPSHFQALNALADCRTQDSLLMKARCESCLYEAYFPHSCGHRFCPHCQHHECQRWIERQREKLVPVDYFMVTVTLPSQLRSLAWENQKLIYSLLFQLGWETLKQFGLNDSALKGLIGATAILHTNTRSLDYHPHVHFVIPAGALDKKHQLWRKKEGKYLFKQESLAKVFYGKWIDAMKHHNLVVKKTIPKRWIASVKHVGSGDKALTYLGKYLYRGVLPEKNILSNENGIITFSYVDNQKNYQTRSLTGVKFLRLLLQHVLPRGFRRARDYGILHPNCKRAVRLIQLVLRKLVPKKFEQVSPRSQFTCCECGALMNIVDVRIPRNQITQTIIGVT